MYHQGKMVGGYMSHPAIIRNDEAVVPPEKSLAYATSVLATRGFKVLPRETIPYRAQGNTGNTTTINVTVSGAIGDHREIARKIHSELNSLRRSREVAA